LKAKSTAQSALNGGGFIPSSRAVVGNHPEKKETVLENKAISISKHKVYIVYNLRLKGNQL
jgi:hypothetical protein